MTIPYALLPTPIEAAISLRPQPYVVHALPSSKVRTYLTCGDFDEAGRDGVGGDLALNCPRDRGCLLAPADRSLLRRPVMHCFLVSYGMPLALRIDLRWKS